MSFKLKKKKSGTLAWLSQLKVVIPGSRDQTLYWGSDTLGSLLLLPHYSCLCPPTLCVKKIKNKI